MCRQKVWDYPEGVVVCLENGEVVDRIYDYSPPRTREDEQQPQLHLWHRPKKVVHGYLRRLKVYMKLLSYEKQLGDSYVVDEEKFMEAHMKNKNQVRTVKHIRSLGIVLTDKDEELIRIGEEFVSKKAPHLLSRSERGKKALSFLVGCILVDGEMPKPKQVVEKFHISWTTYKRLKKLINKFIIE